MANTENDTVDNKNNFSSEFIPTNLKNSEKFGLFKISLGLIIVEMSGIIEPILKSSRIDEIVINPIKIKNIFLF